MAISQIHPKFPIKREKFQDKGAYNEIKQLVYHLNEFRSMVAEAIAILQGAHYTEALSTDPDDPAANSHTIWQSDGTGTGDDGDIMMKITDSSGTTKTTTLVDFSAI